MNTTLKLVILIRRLISNISQGKRTVYIRLVCFISFASEGIMLVERMKRRQFLLFYQPWPYSILHHLLCDFNYSFSMQIIKGAYTSRIFVCFNYCKDVIARLYHRNLGICCMVHFGLSFRHIH